MQGAPTPSVRPAFFSHFPFPQCLHRVLWAERYRSLEASARWFGLVKRQTMTSLTKRLHHRHNTVSLLAQGSGLLCGGLVPLLLTLGLVKWLPRASVFLGSAYAIGSCLRLLGCRCILGMRRVGSYVRTMEGFWNDFRFGFVTMLTMPLLVIAVLVILMMGLVEE